MLLCNWSFWISSIIISSIIVTRVISLIALTSSQQFLSYWFFRPFRLNPVSIIIQSAVERIFIWFIFVFEQRHQFTFIETNRNTCSHYVVLGSTQQKRRSRTKKIKTKQINKQIKVRKMQKTSLIKRCYEWSSTLSTCRKIEFIESKHFKFQILLCIDRSENTQTWQ